MIISGILLMVTPAWVCADDRSNTASVLPALVVHTNFANGNGRIERLDQGTRTVHLSPVEHAQRGWACWWSLETTWNSPHSTIDGYETVGRQLGLALERYLRTNPRLE